MNLQIGKVKNYNNKILISSPSFKIGTNLKINLDVKSKEVEMVKTEPDVKPKVETKPKFEPNKNTRKMLNLTSSLIKSINLSLTPIESTNLTLSLIKSTNRMLRDLILIRSPMRKKRLL